MTKKILRTIDKISCFFLIVMMTAINEMNDLRLVCLIMAFPSAWLIIRCKVFHAFDKYIY